MTTKLLETAYGSHLYGTNTPTSDFDYKVVYLPNFDDVLLGRKLRTYKDRFDAEGNQVGDNQPMPDGGVETEFVPFQTFCTDYLNGQTYALEVAQFWYGKPEAPAWLNELVEQFTTANVNSMAGFAMKQTFDYVHRGERLEAARRLKAALLRAQEAVDNANASPEGAMIKRRLDGVMPNGRKVLHLVADEAGAALGTTENNGRMMETLKLNGRDYLETTDLGHVLAAVDKLIASYGHRSAAAAEMDVDLKSLMHAVRVYEQCVELLTVGRMRFPRAERAYLLNVKQGNVPLEEVKAKLLALEQQVEELQANSTVLAAKTPELQAEFDRWLLAQLRQLYNLR